MKNIFKKYYEMSNDTKEELGRLYMLDELENLLPEYENLNISSITDEEIILEKAIACWYYSNIDGGEVIKRILDVLSGRDITIEDLKNTEIDELIELIIEDKEDFKQIEEDTPILSKFHYDGNECCLFKNGDKFVFIFEKNKKVNVFVLNRLDDFLCFIIDNKELFEEWSNG